jgi:hypothetical protein
MVGELGEIWGDSPETVVFGFQTIPSYSIILSHGPWMPPPSKGTKTNPEAHPCRNPGCPLKHDPCPSLAEAQLPNLPALKVCCQVLKCQENPREIWKETSARSETMRDNQKV